METTRSLLFGGIITLLILASAAFGDGCYFPERAVRKIPEIPSQQAVLSWKNGVETLVISSALDSQSQTLGWIIPLSSVPKTIEKETPGGLKTLNFCIQPKIIHDLSQGLKAAIYSVLIAGWNFFAMIICNERIMQRGGLWWYVAIILFPALIVFTIVSGAVFSFSPKLNADEVLTSRGHRFDYLHQDLRLDIDELLKERPDILQGTEPEIADYLLKTLPEYRESDEEPIKTITGTELAEEDSPSNFTVEKHDGKVVIRVYDPIGRVLATEYSTASR